MHSFRARRSRLPLPPRRGRAKWLSARRNFTHLSESEERSQGWKLYYIGQNDESPLLFEDVFDSGLLINSLSAAHQLIQEVPRSECPDVIIIDIPFEKIGLRYFMSGLVARKLHTKVVVLYNDVRLTSANVSYLKEEDLIDDTITVNTASSCRKEKLRFSRKLKSSYSAGTHDVSDWPLFDISGKKRSMFCKRLIDITFASTLLLISLPVLLLIALAIWLDSPGSVIYHSLRAGRGFKIFKFYKFRTMVKGADKRMSEFEHLNQYTALQTGDAHFVKIANDPRITRIGKFLRNSSLDELPQLINVLKGDMSLVGNRPLPLYEASTLTTNQYVERFMAPAGITGLWQIKKRGQSDMSIEERVNLDILYARNNNVIYDLWIVANTPAALFQKSNV